MNPRNKPCPCGSQLKYKKCCGSEAMLCAKRREEEERQLEAMRARVAEQARKQEELRAAAGPGAIEFRRGPGPRRTPMAAMALLGVAAALDMGGMGSRRKP